MPNLVLRRNACVAAARPKAIAVPGSRSARDDVRWPAIVHTLEALRAHGRCAVRIVDVDCGAGSLLLNALHHARTLGFTAIEGRGVDGSPALIGRATVMAARACDPAIGVVFGVADMMTSLEAEADMPADILLWQGSRVRDRAAVIDDFRRAADVVIGDGDPIGDEA